MNSLIIKFYAVYIVILVIISDLWKKKKKKRNPRFPFFLGVFFLFLFSWKKLETTFAYALRIAMQIQELIFFVSSSPAMYTVDFIKQYEKVNRVQKIRIHKK